MPSDEIRRQREMHRQTRRVLTDDEQKAKYVPTPEQIAEACEKIQREWNEVERARRRGIRKGGEDAWHLPTVGDPEVSDDGL